MSITGGVTAQVALCPGLITGITTVTAPSERSDNFKLAGELVDELSNISLNKPAGYRLEGQSFSEAKNS